jgi:hypothetical protein
MIKRFLQRRLRHFSDHYNYNTDYLDFILWHSLSAFIKFSLFQLMSAHRKGIPLTPCFAAQIRTTMHEDCGPCTQLVCNMASEAGVDQSVLTAIVQGQVQRLPQEVALVVRYTELTLRHDPQAADLREELRSLWGENGLISLGFAISASRVYPTLKYVLGYGDACGRITIGDQAVIPDSGVALGASA